MKQYDNIQGVAAVHRVTHAGSVSVPAGLGSGTE